MNEITPTVYPEFEGDSLIGNSKGFENLRDRINILLEGDDKTILLYEDENFEDFFTWLSLNEEPEIPIEDSGGLFIVYIFVGIFFLGILFAIIGFIQTLSWLLNS